MVGKQSWKLLSDPDAIISRLFKNKYYPRGDFSNSNVGHNPSYSWRSIWSSRVLVKEGIQWRIGDGSSVRVWNEPWLSNKDLSCMHGPVLHEFMDIRVGDLFLPVVKSWNQQLLSQVLLRHECQAVLRVPLSDSVQEDRLLWLPSK